jgi:hypothetical protein
LNVLRIVVASIFIVSNSFVVAQESLFAFETPINGQTVELTKMNDGYNYILFIGNKDSIYSVDWDSQQLPYEYAYQPLEDNGAFRKSLKEGMFKVTVDTSQGVLIPYYPDLPEGLPGSQITDWTVKNRKDALAFPVYIWNVSSETTSIPVEGVTTSVIQEAKDESGIWLPIEYHGNGFCGNGMW